MLGRAHGKSFFSMWQRGFLEFSIGLLYLLASSCMYMLCVFCVSAKFHQSRDDPHMFAKSNANPAGLEGVLLPAFYKAAAASELPLFPSRHGGVPVSLRSAVFLLEGFFRVHLPLAYKAEERLAEATETIRYVGRGTWKRCSQWRKHLCYLDPDPAREPEEGKDNRRVLQVLHVKGTLQRW